MIPTSIHVVALVDPTSDFILQKLSLVAKDSVKHPMSSAATHLVVIYDDVKDVVGGALIRFSASGIVAVNQMFTSTHEHSLDLMKFLRNQYQLFEIHLNVPVHTVDLYKGLGFTKRYRKGCHCGIRNGFIHITWAPIEGNKFT
jgi:hypothetical protein